MDKWVALNNQTNGRDKVARLVQYLCRAIWDSIDRIDTRPASAMVDQFKSLEYILSSFRKLLRFGKCLDVFYAALGTIHNPDLMLRVTLTCGKLSQALFLLGDHFIWLSRTGLFRSINPKKWGNFANRYWLMSIVMNLARDLYEIVRLLDMHKTSSRIGLSQSCFSQPIRSKQDLARLALRSYSLLHGHKDVVVDTVKNLCDVCIPLTALGYFKLSPRTIGFLGVISSTAGLLALIDPHTKLVPC